MMLEAVGDRQLGRCPPRIGPRMRAWCVVRAWCVRGSRSCISALRAQAAVGERMSTCAVGDALEAATTRRTEEDSGRRRGETRERESERTV